MGNVKTWLGLGLAALMLFGLVSLAAAQETATLQVSEHPELGRFLADGEGMTLYLFTRDDENVSNCYDQCAQNWPPLLVEAGVEPSAGEGVGGVLGVTERTDGTRQVTYNGMPLYYYVSDSAPGDTTGQGVGEVWFVVEPAGTAGAAAAAETPAPVLPETGGAATPAAGLLVMAAGALLVAGGLAFAGARRLR
jgi:predicted lipoprotein with Yx(FWY)xxD motif